MGASYQDTFSGSGALGTIEIGGVAWSVLTGTWSRTSGLAKTTTAGTSNPLAVIDVGWGDFDGSISVSSAGGGDCLYFRVVDALNWLRARLNTTTGAVTYGPYVDQGFQALSPGDDAYQNPAFFGVTTFPTDTEMLVFNSNATGFEFFLRSKSTSFNYTAVLEKSVAGTVTQLGVSPSNTTGISALRVVASGSTITLLLSGSSTNSGVFTDSTNATATKHGIGRGNPGTRDASAIDNFALQPLNRVPNAPTLTFPVSNVQLDSTLTQRFAWSFSDPDPGDSQSKVNIYYRVVGAASWTEVTDATPNGFHDFAAGTFTPGSYEWQAETYDAAGHLGARSASAFFTVATPPAGPAFTSPVNNATISQATQVFDWTTTAQDSYQIRSVADDGSGGADTATIYFDLGEVIDAAARTATLSFPTNGRTEHVQIRVKVSGLWSDWTDSTHPVSYTPPATPLVSVTADDATASITVSVTQPTPTGGQPAVVSCDIYRRELDVSGAAVAGTTLRVATAQPANATWTDWAPASGVSYQYEAVAIAANATSTPSRWTPGAGAGSPGTQGVYDQSDYDSAVYS